MRSQKINCVPRVTVAKMRMVVLDRAIDLLWSNSNEQEVNGNHPFTSQLVLAHTDDSPVS
jgi:hypothetical protein